MPTTKDGFLLPCFYYTFEIALSKISQKENHRRQCAQWNRKNRDYFKANYLGEKLAHTKDPPSSPSNKDPVVKPSSRIALDLPRDLMADIIGVDHLIIIEYIVEQAMRHGKGRTSVRAP